MKIRIIGSTFDSSGYDSHTKGISNALFPLADVSMDVPKPPDWHTKVSDQELQMLNTPFTEEATTVMISLPPSWRLALSDNPKRFYGYCIWEGSHIPLAWLPYLADKRVNGVLVPSSHVYTAICNTLKVALNQGKTVFKEDLNSIKDKIIVISHGVSTELFKPIPKLKEKIFTFISNKGFSPSNMSQDRGGVQYIISAFLKEFEENEDIQCIIKINPAYGIPNINDFLKEKGLKTNKNLKFNLDNIDFKLLPKLYNRGHCFVSATRAESFNLPGLEAMACGLPTIQTNFGGQTSYMTDKNSFFVKYKLEEVTHDIAYEGCKWATPDLLDLRKWMRYAFEHQDEIKQMGEQAYKDAQLYTWENSAKKLLKVL